MFKSLDTVPRGTWQMRRRFMFVIVAFCMLTVAYCAIWRPEAALSQTLVQYAFGTIAFTLGSYVFGATWEKVGTSP